MTIERDVFDRLMLDRNLRVKFTPTELEDLIELILEEPKDDINTLRGVIIGLESQLNALADSYENKYDNKMDKLTEMLNEMLAECI